MSDFGKCDVCGGYGFLGSHRCPPLWRVFIEDDEGSHAEEDAWKIYAHYARDAAEEFANQWEAYFAEYTIIDGEEIDVVVISETGERQTYTVRGEMVPHYSASLKNES
jgi:hypothetical protein